MESNQSPFDILGIAPEAELEVAAAAYKALARKYHPDMNPGVPPKELNRRMAILNWAKEELERDLAGWRRRCASKSGAQRARPRSTGSGQTATATKHAPGTIAAVIEPQVVSLPGRKGARAIFTVSASGVHHETIKARFQTGSIDVHRQPSVGSSAVFSVTVVEDFPSDVPDSVVEPIEIVGWGLMVGKVFVSITPASSSVLAQVYGGRVAPTRHVSHEARISFGKHRARTFYEIAVQEPGYLEWMLREGAGSIIERQCARLALAQVRGSYTLRGRPQSKSDGHLPKREPAKVRALPDPNKPRGLWQTLKALVSPKDRS